MWGQGTGLWGQGTGLWGQGTGLWGVRGHGALSQAVVGASLAGESSFRMCSSETGPGQVLGLG